VDWVHNELAAFEARGLEGVCDVLCLISEGWLSAGDFRRFVAEHSWRLSRAVSELAIMIDRMDRG
jgi:hypothetical protein